MDVRAIRATGITATAIMATGTIAMIGATDPARFVEAVHLLENLRY